MASDQKSPEEQEAERKRLEEQVLRTAHALEQLIRGKGSEPLKEHVPDIHTARYVAEARGRAEAAILQKLIELVLPVVGVKAQTIRAHYATSEGPSQVGMEELEAFIGSKQLARSRQAEWLDVPAQKLAGSRPLLGATFDAGDGESGVLQSHDVWLLTDGRLVEVVVVGKWRMVGRSFQQRRAICDSRVINPERAVTDFPFEVMLVSIGQQLYLEDRLLKDKQGPQLAKSREGFDVLIRSYVHLVDEEVSGLRMLAGQRDRKPEELPEAPTGKSSS
jgi:hypothetical protein